MRLFLYSIRSLCFPCNSTFGTFSHCGNFPAGLACVSQVDRKLNSVHLFNLKPAIPKIGHRSQRATSDPLKQSIEICEHWVIRKEVAQLIVVNSEQVILRDDHSL
jgi:hypothetical protein